MPRQLPPIEHRFPKGYHSGNHTQKHPSGYLTPLLKRLIEKKIRFEDPETQKIIKGKVKHAILWRYILNATQGENQAIEGIFDRIDGKIPNMVLDQSTHQHFVVFRNPKAITEENASDIRPRNRTKDIKLSAG